MDDHRTISPITLRPDLEALLRRLSHTESGPYLRPFTPDSKWREARVFVVGTNPATPLRQEFGSFDEYWHNLTCHPAAFEAIYLAQRSGKPSKTTGRIKRFEASLGGIGLLRTNACALPSKHWTDLPAAVRREQLKIGREVLRALVELCRPVAILGHGKEGVRAISTLFNTPLDPYVPLERQWVSASLTSDAAAVQLFAYPHLSGIGAGKGFAVSRMGDELEALGRRLAAELPSV